VYYIVGTIIVVVAFFMGATQKAKGLSFWRYFLLSSVVLFAIFMTLLKAIKGEI